MIHEHHLVVSRTARYYTLGAADAPMAPVRQLWLACHGYSQLAARFIRYLGVLDDAHRLIAAPEALSRFYLDPAMGATHARARVGATWMTREDRLHEIEDQMGYLDAVYAQLASRLGTSQPAMVLLGFSQGVATAARWAVHTRVRIDRLVLWGGLLPGELDVAAQHDRLVAMRPTLVLGTHDEYVSESAMAAERARLQRAGLSTELITFDGGHRLDKEVLRTLAERVDETAGTR